MENDNFLLANLDMSGFYRVNYDESNWNLIAQQLANNKDVNKIFLKVIYYSNAKAIWKTQLKSNNSENYYLTKWNKFAFFFS